MTNENYCTGCFAYVKGTCSVLITACPPKKKCSFKKSRLQFHKDALAAAKRQPKTPTNDIVIRKNESAINQLMNNEEIFV